MNGLHADSVRKQIGDRLKNLIKNHSKDKSFVIPGHDYRNVLDISSKIILMNTDNVRVIKEFNDLIEFGYLPATPKTSNS
ncbi:ABC-type nitrate/sulfonate/bicarbonate transport system ATPase subunit [Pedobacter sp. UYP30]|uniref:hypothetical protein n=1 Tax=Pedobacter sp. UYP30 TaxID=1756400 RepID=UPI00339B200E